MLLTLPTRSVSHEETATETRTFSEAGNADKAWSNGGYYYKGPDKWLFQTRYGESWAYGDRVTNKSESLDRVTTTRGSDGYGNWNLVLKSGYEKGTYVSASGVYNVHVKKTVTEKLACVRLNAVNYDHVKFNGVRAV